MSPSPVGIVILNFNAGQLVLDCVASALESTVMVSIAVADNGSSDGSLERLQADYRNDERVSIVANGENLGFSAGCNRAFEVLDTHTDFVLFLNPDCRIKPGTLENMLIAIRQEPGVGMAGCLILNEDGSEQRGCRRNEPTPMRTLSTITHFGKRAEGVNRVGEALPNHPVEVDAISGAFMLVRREALDQVGLMDEDYFLHCEDLDWAKRFRLAGWKILFVPTVEITHVKGGSSRNRAIRVEWHKHHGMVRYYQKFYRKQYPFYMMWLIYLAVWGRFVLLLPSMLLSNLRALLRR